LACSQFYVNQRWLGGTLTNLATIRKSIGRLRYIEEIEKSPEYKKMGKQELAALNREAAKLRRNLEGIIQGAALRSRRFVQRIVRSPQGRRQLRHPRFCPRDCGPELCRLTIKSSQFLLAHLLVFG